jgi:hypothetical protein
MMLMLMSSNIRNSASSEFVMLFAKSMSLCGSRNMDILCFTQGFMISLRSWLVLVSRFNNFVRYIKILEIVSFFFLFLFLLPSLCNGV